MFKLELKWVDCDDCVIGGQNGFLGTGNPVTSSGFLSQAAACDGQVYTVNYSNTQPGTQTDLLPLFEVWKHHIIQLNESAG